MDERRVGRALHVLRRAGGLRQRDVAARAGVAQATVSAIERGHSSATSLRTLERVFDVVEGDVAVVIRYRGGELDRLLDEGHAATVTELATLLRADGWRVDVEVSFNHYGDRGSIDLLAYHTATRTLLVVEVKTEIASAEETLRRLDVKARVAPLLAPERFGEKPARAVRLLAVRSSTVNRQRVARLETLFGPTFPLRGRALAAWLRSPGPIVGGRPGGLLFVRNIAPAGRTHGVRRVRASGQASARSSRA
jgi:transcriptional regulator with XRE-family HTH domain